MLHRATRRLVPSSIRPCLRPPAVGWISGRGQRAPSLIQAACLSSIGVGQRHQQEQGQGKGHQAWPFAVAATMAAGAAAATGAALCSSDQQQVKQHGGSGGGSRRRCYVWGDTRWLQGPDAAPPSAPLPLPIEDDVGTIAFGPSFAVVLLADGRALWASAATHTQGLQPLALPDPKMDPAVEAACSADRIYLRTQAGRVYHWPVARLIRRSLSASSTLGGPRRSTGNTTSSPASPVLGGRRSGASSTPLPPSEFATLVGGDGSAQTDGHIVVTSMAAGHKHLLLVTADGVVLAAGSNAQGQLGLPGDVTLEEPRELPFFLHLQTTRGLSPVHVVAGHNHSFVLCQGRRGAPKQPQQELYAFGSDRWLQLGLGEAWAERGGPLVRRPQKVTTLPTAAGGVGGIAAGGDHSLFLVAHQAYAAGHGQFGQLGTGARVHVGGPVKVLAPHRKMGPIAALAVGRDHALLLTGGSDPWVAGWGRNKRRQAHYACPAADTKGDLLQPTVIPLLLDPGIDAAAVVRAVVAGYDSSAVVVEEGAYVPSEEGQDDEEEDENEEVEDAGGAEAEGARHDEEAE